MELEHSTLPPYLCALYSLDADRNPEATEVMVSVLVEEMLHMALVANLMNAVGGRPRLDTTEMLAPYPRCLPHGDCSFEVPLLPFGPEALEVFLKVEKPAPPRAAPESNDYETIAQYYHAIVRGLRELCTEIGESRVFCGDPARQVTDAFYSGGGRIITVENLATALAALEEIVVQQLKLGRRYRCGDTSRSGPTGEPILVDWDGVRPMRSNPRTTDHAPGSPIRGAQEEFNRTYCTILQLLEQAFDGRPQILGTAIGAMYGLKAQAQTLMQLPTEDGLATAGPTFEYVPPSRRASEQSMLGVRPDSTR
jgi:hypothetical protein